MNILVSANDTYVMPLTVLLESLFANHSEAIDVWFMWSELSEENREFFRSYIGSRGAALFYVPVGEAEFRGLPTKSYISRETYFRLLAAEYLPESVDRILWLDADMVVNGSLSDFYHRDLKGMAVAACPHGPVMKPTILENCANLGIRVPAQYFNAGVMLCDLKKWRGMEIPARIEEILRTPRKMMFPGQDLTNLLFNGSVRTEDWRLYNCMTHSVLPEDLPELSEKARIIHYAGYAKPWDFYDLPFSDIWDRYYAQSPFGKEKLRRTSLRAMKKMYEKLRISRPDMYEKIQAKTKK